MATTTNYGWTTPDDTDLVKNGASAIRNLGTSVDTALWNAGYAAAKNKIINGDFSINQRNFTSTTATGYGFDRWRVVAADGTVTYSAQTFTTGAAPVSGYEAINFARIVTTGQTAAGAIAILQQRIEDVRTFAGQTITISFWAKAGSGTPQVSINPQQNFGSGGSPSASVDITAQKKTLSTSWARYSATFSIPSISGKTIGTTANTSFLNISLWTSAGTTYNTQTDSLGIQSATIDFWDIQVEAGSVSTPFQTATGTIQGELAACQRYYWRANAEQVYGALATGYATSTTGGLVYLQMPVTMRVTPTGSLDYGNVRVLDSGFAGTLTTLALNTTECSRNVASITLTGTGYTAHRPIAVSGNNNAAGYVAVTAEL